MPHRNGQQKPKKWFVPKKLNFKAVSETWSYGWGLRTEINEDFTHIQWSSHGGINHTNRDRKGGHVSQNHVSYYSDAGKPALSDKELIAEGYNDYLDEVEGDDPYWSDYDSDWDEYCMDMQLAAMEREREQLYLDELESESYSDCADPWLDYEWDMDY